VGQGSAFSLSEKTVDTMETSTDRAFEDWAEDSDDLRRTAEILGRLTLDTQGRNAGVSLDLLTTPAVALLPTADWVSVTTLSHGRFRTVASSDDIATEIDLLQYEHGTGPCVDAVLAGGIFASGDVAREPRWHPLGEQVHEAFGVNSMLALRLHLLDESDTIAGLNFSSSTPDAFSQADVNRARILATHSALLVSATQAQNKAATLLKALESNREIGVAIGVLMARHGLTREQAFDVLRHASQNTNRKLAHVAAEVAETGAHPQTA
jgi:hypothetical protein